MKKEDPEERPGAKQEFKRPGLIVLSPPLQGASLQVQKKTIEDENNL